jgi:hypothetical protein
MAANLGLNYVQGLNAGQRLGGRGRGMGHVDVVEFTPGVSPACVRISPGEGKVM